MHSLNSLYRKVVTTCYETFYSRAYNEKSLNQNLERINQILKKKNSISCSMKHVTIIMNCITLIKEKLGPNLFDLTPELAQQASSINFCEN